MTEPIIGIDEVGRGCLAGPLCLAAVFLLETVVGLRDSKKLSSRARAILAIEIKQKAHVGFGWVSPVEIDTVGLSKALYLGASRAIACLPPDDIQKATIIIDGTINLLPKHRTKTLIKADNTVPAVMAASIVAKVARDGYMSVIHRIFPHYSFAQNKGYGTAVHLAAINQYGGSPVHRYSFAPLSSLNKDRA